MGFLDNVKDFAESATKSVSSMTKSASAKMDTKMKIRELKKEKEEALAKIRWANEKIGEMFVTEYVDKIIMDEQALKDLLSKINDNKLKIQDLENQVTNLEKELDEKLEDIEREKYEE